MDIDRSFGAGGGPGSGETASQSEQRQQPECTDIYARWKPEVPRELPDEGVTGKLLPTDMDCYSCHAQHGAVDTTFVQFYPTLLEIAKKKNTLSAAYVKEESRQAEGDKKKQ